MKKHNSATTVSEDKSSASEDNDHVDIDFDFPDIAADAAAGGGHNFRTIEEPVYDISDSRIVPDTAITHMDHCGIADLSKYWAKCVESLLICAFFLAPRDQLRQQNQPATSPAAGY